MREIKFRAWNGKFERMAMWETIAYWTGDGFKNIFFESNDYILMQYTGLKDKNGKEIYEGDWMGDGYVKWIERTAEFKLMGSDWEQDMAYASQNREVTGNIYENPPNNNK